MHDSPLNGSLPESPRGPQPESPSADFRTAGLQPCKPTNPSSTSVARSVGGPTISLDELSNTITHGLGFLLSLGAVVFFWQATSSQPLGLRISCLVFATTMAIVYLCSTLSHALQSPRLRSRMRAWDQGTIYLLISRHVHSVHLDRKPYRLDERRYEFGLVGSGWGFYLKVIAKYRIEASSTVTYVLLGWIPAIVLFRPHSNSCVLWMVAGGLSYTLGILFLVRSHRWYTHSLWHLAVIGGSACHSIAVWHLLWQLSFLATIFLPDCQLRQTAGLVGLLIINMTAMATRCLHLSG
ncbi:MAG: hemolysin III family protein [Pirellulaceae bacterium]